MFKIIKRHYTRHARANSGLAISQRSEELGRRAARRGPSSGQPLMSRWPIRDNEERALVAWHGAQPPPAVPSRLAQPRLAAAQQRTPLGRVLRSEQIVCGTQSSRSSMNATRQVTMYAGAAGFALILSIIPTVLEDRTLLEQLPGYREYARRARYRLIPGLW